jgi:hypothetical protein
MLRLAKAFIDIALWRQTPASLPASLFLLGLLVVISASVEVLDALMPPASLDGIFMRIVVSVAVPLLFAWAVLAIAKRRHRFLQTGSALLGVGVLASVLLYPLNELLRAIGDSSLFSIPVGLVFCAGFCWYLLACAHIWRASLDSGLLLGSIISVGYFILTLILERQLLLPT